MIDSQGLSGIVLSFAKREFKADKLFNQTEEEILYLQLVWGLATVT